MASIAIRLLNGKWCWETNECIAGRHIFFLLARAHARICSFCPVLSMCLMVCRTGASILLFLLCERAFKCEYIKRVLGLIFAVLLFFCCAMQLDGIVTKYSNMKLSLDAFALSKVRLFAFFSPPTSRGHMQSQTLSYLFISKFKRFSHSKPNIWNAKQFLDVLQLNLGAISFFFCFTPKKREEKREIKTTAWPSNALWLMCASVRCKMPNAVIFR